MISRFLMESSEGILMDKNYVWHPKFFVDLRTCVPAASSLTWRQWCLCLFWSYLSRLSLISHLKTVTGACVSFDPIWVVRISIVALSQSLYLLYMLGEFCISLYLYIYLSRQSIYLSIYIYRRKSWHLHAWRTFGMHTINRERSLVSCIEV